MTNSKYVPKRRFKEFESDGEWEQKNLSSIADIRDGTHSSPKYLEAGHPFITSKNVANGFISFEDIQYISNEDFNEINKRSKVDVHDILMGMIGTVGNLALIRQTPFFAIKNVALIKYTGDVDYEFLYQALQTSNVNRQLKDSIDGGTQKFISLKKIRNLNIPFSNISEQLKIGKFFQTIDLLIQLHQHKLDKLKDLKKAYLSEMFPAEGKRVPKRRFPGFEGEWEQMRLGDIAERFDNLRVPVASKDRVSGTIPYYGANGIQDYVDGFTHNGEFVLLAEDGANDLKNYPVHYVKGKIWVNNHAHVIQGKEDLIDNRFLLFAVKQIQIEPYLVGGGRAKLNADIMMDLPLIIPEILEQKSIGSFLMTLDKRITLQQQKIDKLNDLKKAYLNELFV